LTQDFKNPIDELRRDIGRKADNTSIDVSKIKEAAKARIEANKANRQMEIEAKELKCWFYFNLKSFEN
jgi:hypothetical protein